ncbi:MAG: pantoate--beta-alanine ligase [Planctomycetaceae bacterium]|nr:pantoate--beta-alanine ligase [Planctomycetaceae bacterium]
MIVEASAQTVRQLVRQNRSSGRQIGVVPTMGALHAGHVSLIEVARRTCDFVVATIFVNPTQFGPGEDFDRYPRTLESDLQMCAEAGADLVFTPDVTEMYPRDVSASVHVRGSTEVLEGVLRPGHFDGVTTIVAKLFNITEPDRAYFGQKDFQQQLVIRHMVQALDFGLEIVTCPIIREPDGLAMSSRNRYLSAAERLSAVEISRALRVASQLAESSDLSPPQIAEQMRAHLTATGAFDVQYAVIADCHSLELLTARQPQAVALIAARLGQTRLIDNQILQFR